MATHQQRFARLFRGYSKRYGRYTLSGVKSEKGKMEGSAKTVDVEITEDDYGAHIAGSYGIGIVPLCEDGIVHFGAIDVDDYSDVDHFDFAIRVKDEPVVVTRSKSNGVHIWLFSEEGVPALVAINYLKGLAAQLGVGGSEIFPKQAERASNEDVGNWINLPYFGGQRTAVILEAVDGALVEADPTIDNFLKLAELCASADEGYLVQRTATEDSQRDGMDSPGMWKDGPPCLQRLFAGLPEKRTSIKRRFDDGEITQEQYDKQMAATLPKLTEFRNNGFYNLAVYLKRREQLDGPLDQPGRERLFTEMKAIQAAWMASTGNSGLDDQELRTLAKQGAADKWSYKCKEQPIVDFCNRRLCLRRKFGIGAATAEPALEISGFTRIDTDPPLWAFNVGEDQRRVTCTTDDLLNQRAFRVRIANTAFQVWPAMGEGKVLDEMNGFMKSAAVVAGPSDTGQLDRIVIALLEYFERRKLEKTGGEKDSRIFDGHTLLSDKGETAWIMLRPFERYLRHEFPDVKMSATQLGATLVHECGAQNYATTIGGRDGKQGSPYIFEIEKIRKMRAGD